MQTAKGEGMQLMDQHLLEHLKEKKITPDEAYRCCNDKKAFEQFLPNKPGSEQA